MKDISIIIPMFNGRNYIKRNVNELLKIHHSKEIIIIDDGSSDDSYDFCLREWKNHPDIKLIQQCNSGIVKTRNVGLQEATSKYVIFVDQDDMVVSDVIDSSIDRMIKENCQMGIWSTDFLAENGGRKKCDQVYENAIVFNEEVINSVLVPVLTNNSTKYCTYIGHVWACIFELKLIKDNNILFKKFIDYEDDYLFVVDALANTNSCMFIVETGYFWSINYNSYSHTKKYLKNYLMKSENLEKYIMEVAQNSSLNNGDIEKIEAYWRQSTIIKAIRNAGSCQNVDWKEVDLVKKRMKTEKYRNAFRITLLLENDSRYKILFWLLRVKLYSGAALLVNIYYNYYCKKIVKR